MAKAAYDIFKDAIDKMVDKACDDEMENRLKSCALAQEGVMPILPYCNNKLNLIIYPEIITPSLTPPDSHAP